MAQETIKEFLVSLGYGVNASQERKFTDAIEGATLRAKLLGDAIEETARKIGASVGAAAEDFERLYYQSRNSKVAAGDLRDMGYAASQLGSSAASAAQNLEEMGQKLRENSGNAIYFRQFGLEFDKVTGKVVYNANLAANGVGKMSEAVREQYRQLAGLSTDFAQSIYSDPFEFQRQIDRSAATRRAIGFDPAEAAEDAKRFNQVWRDTFNRIDDLGSKFFTDMMRDLTGPLTALDSFIEAHQVDISNALTKFSAGVGAVAQGVEKWVEGGGLEKVSTAVTTLADDVEDAVDAFGGWQPMLETMAAFWVGSKALGMIANVRILAGAVGLLGTTLGALTLPLWLSGDADHHAIDPNDRTGADRVREALGITPDAKSEHDSDADKFRGSHHRDSSGNWIRNDVQGPPTLPATAAPAPTDERATSLLGRISSGFSEWWSGSKNGQKITVDGTPVNSGNPLPVTLGQQDQLNAEWAGSNGVGDYRGAPASGGNAGASSAPADTRNWWQRTAPSFLGGQAAPALGAGNATGKWWTAERMQHAADRLVKEAGLSPMGAAGLVARWAGVEAGAGPTAHNPTSGAFGIGQWLGSRLPGIAGNTDFDAQLGYAVKELNSTEAKAAAALRSAKTSADGARGASMFERAEHYNAGMGTDDWTSKTPVDSVYRAIYGGGAGSQFAIGDSIAHRLQLAGGIPGIGVDGANPKAILANIGGLVDGSLAGKRVALSGGASNNVADTDLTAKEIDAIKAKGAKASDITLLGVGERADFQAAKVNDRLRQIAKDAGVAFQELGETDRDLVHPTIARAKQIAADLGRSSAAANSTSGGLASVAGALKYPFIGPAMAAGTSPANDHAALRAAQASAGFGGVDPSLLRARADALSATVASQALGGSSSDTSNDNSTTNHNSVSQKVDIHVDGSMDPEITARMVGANVNRVNADLTRNLLGAAQ